MPTDAHGAIDAIWRIESPKLIAALTRVVRDVAIAEDLAQDALVAALEQWPESGMPENPGAWLMATAKHRAIDLFRRNAMAGRKRAVAGQWARSARVGTTGVGCGPVPRAKHAAWPMDDCA